MPCATCSASVRCSAGRLRLTVPHRAYDTQVTGFLDDVLHKSYFDKVVISPHVYPPSVTKLGDPDAWLGAGPVRYTEGIVTQDTPRCAAANAGASQRV